MSQAAGPQNPPAVLTPADGEDAGTALSGAHSSRYPHSVAQPSPDIIQVKGCLTPRKHQGPLNPYRRRQGKQAGVCETQQCGMMVVSNGQRHRMKRVSEGWAMG